MVGGGEGRPWRSFSSCLCALRRKEEEGSGSFVRSFVLPPSLQNAASGDLPLLPQALDPPTFSQLPTLFPEKGGRKGERVDLRTISQKWKGRAENEAPWI